jgi:hypothetical protein
LFEEYNDSIYPDIDKNSPDLSKKIVKGLLRYDPNERLSLEQVLGMLFSAAKSEKQERFFDGY